MKFVTTKLAGAFVIELEPHRDERGFFSRSWCEDEFGAQGLATRMVQSNVSLNVRKGTLRGLHFQRHPHEEVKLVRCTRGKIFDVMVDLRPESPTYKQWVGAELTEDNHTMLYVPRRFAHGFITLTETAEVFYQVSHVYNREAASGALWNDPAFGIEWPIEPSLISPADRSWPAFDQSPFADSPAL
ncbi:MAG TPA: dTDP-4-dehydrorhamnose 3,5-epimerase [Polyangiales bacterium]